jgi:elongation factor G
VWRQADKYGVPRIAYINKMDRVGADFYRGLKMIKDRFGANPVALQMPIDSEERFRGVVDLVRNKAILYTDDLGSLAEESEIPPEIANEAGALRDRLLEAVAESDDELMNKYLENEELTEEEIKEGLRKATLSVKLVPLLCGSSLKKKRVKPL